MPANSPVQLDDFDHKILIELERDGVLTAAALAERIGLSPSACHRRVKAMEAAGVIEGYAAILSEKALGRSATVFVAVTLDNQRSETMAAFERAVAKCREVQDCHLMTGESDTCCASLSPTTTVTSAYTRKRSRACPACAGWSRTSPSAPCSGARQASRTDMSAGVFAGGDADAP